jgi:hypothetical protein
MMATTFNCDRCNAPMGKAPDAVLEAKLGEGFTLRGPECRLNADLCVACFLALREWLWPPKEKSTSPAP